MLKSKQGKNAIAAAIIALLILLLVLTFIPEVKQTVMDLIGAIIRK